MEMVIILSYVYPGNPKLVVGLVAVEVVVEPKLNPVVEGALEEPPKREGAISYKRGYK